MPVRRAMSTLPPPPRRAWRFWLALAALAGAALALALLLRAPAFDDRAFGEVAALFEEQTRGFAQGRRTYPLDPRPAARLELAYLEGLPAALDPRVAGCAATARTLGERLRAFRQEAGGPSIFQHAARQVRARQGQDLVRGLSDQIAEPPFLLGPGQREAPAELEARMQLLQERSERAEIAARALAALSRALVAAEAFARSCRAERDAARQALGYLLEP